MSILIWIIIPLYVKTNVALLHCYLYSHYRYQRTCDVIVPNAPSQEVGHWSGPILHTACVFIDSTPGAPLKISMPPIPSMVRAAIIEYAPYVSLSSYC